MKPNHSFFLGLFFFSSMNGSATTQEEPVAKTLFAKSFNDEDFTIDHRWIKESTWLQKKVTENPLSGTAKKPLVLPLDISRLEELESLVHALASNGAQDVYTELQMLVPEKEGNEITLTKKIQKLKRLYEDAKTMGIGRLESILLDAIISTLRHEVLLNAFALNPKFLRGLLLPDELMKLPVKVLKSEDQEFLLAQLCTVFKSQKQPTLCAIDPAGNHAITGGTLSKKSGFFTILDLVNGVVSGEVSTTYALHGVLFFNGQILTWGKKRIDLWDTRGTHLALPPLWTELLKDAQRTWGVVTSKDQTLLALGIDEKIFLINHQKNAYLTLEAPRPKTKEKEGKRKPGSQIFFGDNDGTLIETRPTGELFFYSTQLGKCFFQGQTSASGFRHCYVHGPTLYTLTMDTEIRKWDCSQEKAARREQHLFTGTHDYVPYGHLVQFEKGRSKVFCDTSSQEFIDKLLFLPTRDKGTTAKDKQLFLKAQKMSRAIVVGEDGIPTMQVNTQEKELSIKVSFPLTQHLVSGCMNHEGTVLLCIGSLGTLGVWHSTNQDAMKFLSSPMTLEQGLGLELLRSILRSEDHSLKEFLKVPHIRDNFKTWDPTLRRLLVMTYPALKESLGADHLTLLNATQPSGTLGRALSSSSLRQKKEIEPSTHSPLASPRVATKVPTSNKEEMGGEDAQAIKPITPRRTSNNDDDEETPETDPLVFAPHYQAALLSFNKGDYETAYPSFLELHARADKTPYKAYAAHYIGEMLLSHQGISYDPALAVTYFKEAVKQDSDETLRAESYERLGTMNFYGIGVAPSQSKAIDSFKKILRVNESTGDHEINPEASFRSTISAFYFLCKAGRKYQEIRINDDPYYTPAMELCEKTIQSTNNDHSLALLYKGRLLLLTASKKTAYALAAACFLEAADSPDEALQAEAYYRLGKVFFTHLADDSEAQKSFDKVRTQRFGRWTQPLAELYLGHIYNKQSDKWNEAFAHYHAVTQQDDFPFAKADGFYFTARLHEKSADDLKKDPKKVWERVFENDSRAVKICSDASLHHVNAHFSLGKQYLQGTPFLAKDLHKALNHFKIVERESTQSGQIEEASLFVQEIEKCI